MEDHKKDSVIAELTEKQLSGENISLYQFTDKKKSIKINTQWFPYLAKHINILQDYTFWHLVKYLQKNNPNVPNIASKLFPPEKRNLSIAKRFWNIYFSSKDNDQCIYSGQNLDINNYSIDHFLPWSFVGHDQLWNLTPTIKEINSSKGDKLPSSEYLDKFVNLQFDAFSKVLDKISIRSKLAEDYIILFNKTLFEIKSMPKIMFLRNLKDTLQPQMQIAKNMGFPSKWIYYDLSFKK